VADVITAERRRSEVDKARIFLPELAAHRASCVSALTAHHSPTITGLPVLRVLRVQVTR
jgi:hypothetical protein